jgi:hypothetical protein
MGGRFWLDADATGSRPKNCDNSQVNRVHNGIDGGFVCQSFFPFSAPGLSFPAWNGNSVRSAYCNWICGKAEGEIIQMMEELFSSANIVWMGFVFWLIISPKLLKARDNSLFPAYMIALYLCLTVTSDIMYVMPTAFFFSVGGGLAFCYMLARLMVRTLLGR